MSHTFRQFGFTIVIIYVIAVSISNSEVSSKDRIEDIFLRIYVGPTVHEYIDYSLENASAITSRINKTKPTVMYIHGYSENLERESVLTMIQAYLQRSDHNMIGVDYGSFQNDTYVNLTLEIVAIADALTAALERMKKSGFDIEKLHIVSHSFGSQIAGYIGRKVSFPIPRITGLDPAGPLFNLFLPHLSFSDARFVDIIYTDRGGFGNAKTSGTVNFFPNGGKRIQPDCPKNPDILSNDDYCSHHRSWTYFAESLIKERAFVGVQCPSFSDFNSDKCSNNTQIVMGYATPSSARGTVYLVTNDHSPFGLYNRGLTPAN